MYVAMNRFHVLKDAREDFETLWRERDSHLAKTPGFMEFSMLRGPTSDEYILYISQSRWESESAFRAWMTSEDFRRTHRDVGSARDMYNGPPVFEGYEALEGM